MVPVNNSSGSWNLDNVKFGVNGKAFPSVASMNMAADTGAPPLWLPTAAVDGYFENVPGAVKDSGRWSYPCGTALPDLDVFFSEVSLGPESVSIAGEALKLDLKSDSEGQACHTWMVGIPESNKKNRGSLGMPFFSSMYIEWWSDAPMLVMARQR